MAQMPNVRWKFEQMSANLTRRCCGAISAATRRRGCLPPPAVQGSEVRPRIPRPPRREASLFLAPEILDFRGILLWGDRDRPGRPQIHTHPYDSAVPSGQAYLRPICAAIGQRLYGAAPLLVYRAIHGRRPPRFGPLFEQRLALQIGVHAGDPFAVAVPDLVHIAR